MMTATESLIRTANSIPHLIRWPTQLYRLLLHVNISLASLRIEIYFATGMPGVGLHKKYYFRAFLGVVGYDCLRGRGVAWRSVAVMASNVLAASTNSTTVRNITFLRKRKDFTYEVR